MILGYAKNIKTLTIAKDMNDLEGIAFEGCAVKNIHFLGDMNSLETLGLGASDIESLTIKGSMNALRSLMLDNDSIETLWLEGAMPKMKGLSFGGIMGDAKNLRSLTLNPQTEEAKKVFKAFKIDPKGSGITNKSQIKGYEYLDEKNVMW